MKIESIQVLKADEGMILKKIVEGAEPVYTPSVMLSFGETADDWTEITIEQYEKETGGDSE